LGLDGIDSVYIEVNSNTIIIDDYTYLGNGSFGFYYSWSGTPFEIARNTTSNATLSVIDITSLSDQDVESFIYPTASDFIISLLSSGFIVIFILLIFSRHLSTEWDTDKSKNNQGIMPTTLTGKRSR
jgi:hypothetical protein